MDLKKLNKEYVDYKSSKTVQTTMEKIRSLKENHQKNLMKIDAKINLENSKLEVATMDNKSSEITKAQNNIKNLENDKKEILDKILKLKTYIDENNKKIDSVTDEIKQNPEMQEYLNNVMKKKFSRKLGQIHEEKENLQNLKELLNKNPNLEKQLIGMVNAKSNIVVLEEELEKLDAKVDAVRINEIQNVLIPNAQSKFKVNKDIVISDAQKHKLNISEETIEEFSKSNFSRNSNGEINFKKSIDKKIKGADKQIRTYETALSKVIGKQVDIQSVPNTQMSSQSSSVELEENSNLPVVSENKGFFSRISNWFKQKFSNKSKSEATEKSEIQKQATDNIERSQFKNALKYEVVKDIAEKYETDLLKNAKIENKNKQELEEKEQDEK